MKGIIREIGIRGDTFAVECKNKDGDGSMIHWVRACAKIPQGENTSDDDEDVDVIMKEAPSMPAKAVILTDETFKLYVNSFVTEQRQIWKNELQQIQMLKQVTFTDQQIETVMKKIDLPLKALSTMEEHQQIMNMVWSAKFVAFYEQLVAKSLPKSLKQQLLSVEQQNVLMKSLMDNQFNTFNDSLVKWNLDAGTSGAWLFQQCISIEEGIVHDCRACIAQDAVLKNYWCCRLYLSDIFVTNEWNIIKSKNKNPFFTKLPKSQPASTTIISSDPSMPVAAPAPNAPVSQFGQPEIGPAE